MTTSSDNLASEQVAKVGRLALRHEGNMWNAYYALPDTMQDPIFLGSIHMGAVTDNPQRKDAFMLMMRDVVGEIIEASTGIKPTWGGPQTAPEHERSGHG